MVEVNLRQHHPQFVCGVKLLNYCEETAINQCNLNGDSVIPSEHAAKLSRFRNRGISCDRLHERRG